ncbi:hypothetical protein MTR_4g087370 [Medicago truncatula]|uniref:Uncharacterized protein n=1 Tax=Medicago truncatula TaxID=3880 RepID=G7JNM3_MEDTR|nr:hypothetical protein MTR_4g087370 [Medicago truncatula]
MIAMKRRPWRPLYSMRHAWPAFILKNYVMLNHNFGTPCEVLWCCIFLSQNSKKLQQSEKDIMIGDVGWHLGKMSFNKDCE